MRSAILFVCAACIASGANGIQPRQSASDYAGQQTGSTFTVAATLLSPEQTRDVFGDDMNAIGYMVVEVAVYPDANQKVHLSPHDFLLSAKPGTASAQAVTPAGLPSELLTSLAQKALPEGAAGDPVAGYLYFPKLSIHRARKGLTGSIDLTWNAPGGPIRVTLETLR